MGNIKCVQLPLDIWQSILDNTVDYNTGIKLSSTCKTLYNCKPLNKYNLGKYELKWPIPCRNADTHVVTMRDYHFYNWAKYLHNNENINMVQLHVNGICTNIEKNNLVGDIIMIEKKNGDTIRSSICLKNEDIIDHGDYRQILLDVDCFDMVFYTSSPKYKRECFGMGCDSYCMSDKLLGKHEMTKYFDTYNSHCIEYYFDGLSLFFFVYYDKIIFHNKKWFNFFA